MKQLLSISDLEGIAPFAALALVTALNNAKPTAMSRKALEGAPVVAINYGIKVNGWSLQQALGIDQPPPPLPPVHERLVVLSVSCSRCCIRIGPDEKPAVHQYVASALTIPILTI